MLRKKSSVRREIVGMTLAAVAGLSLAGAGIALAASNTNTGTDPLDEVQNVNYFTGGKTVIGTANGSGPAVNVTYPQEDIAGGHDEICAMFYVYDAAQNLRECCGCPITSDGLITVPLNAGTTPDKVTKTVLPTDLVNNPVPNSLAALNTGVIRIVSAERNGCQIFGGINPSSADTNCTDDSHFQNGKYRNVCDATGGFFPGGQYGQNTTYNLYGTGRGNGPGTAFLVLDENLRAWATHVQNSSLTESEFRDDSLTQNDADNLAEACGDLQGNGSGQGVCGCGVGGLED